MNYNNLYVFSQLKKGDVFKFTNNKVLKGTYVKVNNILIRDYIYGTKYFGSFTIDQVILLDHVKFV